MGSKSIRIALMGTGTIGRELLRRTSGHAEFTYVAVGDSSGFLAKREGFTEAEERARDFQKKIKTIKSACTRYGF